MRLRGAGLPSCVATALSMAVLALGVAAAHAVEPGVKHVTLPEALGLHPEAVRISSTGGAELSGWWFGADTSASTVVIAPRGRGTMADLLPAAREFQARGLAVLTFDYRGFGPGTTDHDTLRTIVFHSQWVDDMVAALAFARSRAGAGHHVFAWGQDLGSAVALAAAARHRRNCDGIAIEGLFRTSQEELRRAGTSSIPGISEKHQKIVGGQDEPFSAAARLQVPAMVLLAGRDSVTTAAVTRQVIGRSLLMPVELWSLPEAGHGGAELAPGYFDRVCAWFKRLTAFPAGS